MKHLKYAFLNLKGHYRGDLMLQKLIAFGYLPLVVIEEESSLAVKSRNTILRDLELKEGIVHDFEKLGVKHIIVANHNEQEVELVFRRHQIELVILGDCRILKRRVFGIPQFGTINIHPGYLPIVRGNNPYIWALIQNLPQGCTAHFIDDEIDTGDVIVRKNIFLKNITSYKELLININELCADIIVNIFREISTKGTIKSTKQVHLLNHGDKIHYFTFAPDSIKQKAKQYWD
jgi:methionyl-tRNA formyltransferase